ncbi:MAG: DUF4056 domain-containing protein [Sedimentisphaerales bacterium]|nr:DUF4056 domain-containing protein [Sedimentisphaerales bacterium]
MRKIRFFSVVVISCLLLFGGCSNHRPFDDPAVRLGKSFKRKPRPRIGSYPASTLGTAFHSNGSLGKHGYYWGVGEKKGIIYTCRAGHIDLAHLRKTADWAAYLSARMYRNLMKNKSDLNFKMLEASRYYVYLHYPDGWYHMEREKKEMIAYEVAIELGQYFSYTATTWHEILTWFGYKCTGLYSEFPSAFSWEDTYSNLLGTRIGAMALYDRSSTYDQAMTRILEDECEKLDIQSSRTAKEAAAMMRGKWFKGDYLFFVELNGRNFDIGLDDGYVTPWIVSGIGECDGENIVSLPVPKLDSLKKYGFTMDFEIGPKEWETGEILRIVYPNDGKKPRRINPKKHFPIIMKHIVEANSKN